MLRPRNIRMRKILALEQKLGAVRFGAGVGQAIAEIQAGAVFAALAVAFERVAWAKMSGNSACRKANCDIAKSHQCLTPPTRGLPDARRSSSAIPGEPPTDWPRSDCRLGRTYASGSSAVFPWPWRALQSRSSH